MTYAANGPRSGPVLRGCFLALFMGVAACTNVPVLDLFGSGTAETTGEFSRGSLDRLWLAPPGALTMVQRTGSGGADQIIGLENETALEGDNFLWVNAHARSGGAFRLEALMRRIGEVPHPFTSLDNRNLRSAGDGQGAYFWQEYRSGANTNCVIAFRRLERGGRALDVFLRNCVQGSIDAALQPIRTDRVAYSSLAGPVATDRRRRTLSPLAGPGR